MNVNGADQPHNILILVFFSAVVRDLHKHVNIYAIFYFYFILCKLRCFFIFSTRSKFTAN